MKLSPEETVRVIGIIWLGLRAAYAVFQMVVGRFVHPGSVGPFELL